MSGASQELQAQMRQDLFAAYAEVTSRPCPSQQIAWIRTVKHPAPRYYIGAKKAVNIIGQLMLGNRAVLDSMRSYKKRMYIELEQEVLRLSEKKEYQGKSLKYICSFAILHPAKEFYISWETFKKIFCNAKRYGINFAWKDVLARNSQYTNRRDGKPKDAIYTGKKHLIITAKCKDSSLL